MGLGSMKTPQLEMPRTTPPPDIICTPAVCAILLGKDMSARFRDLETSEDSMGTEVEVTS